MPLLKQVLILSRLYPVLHTQHLTVLDLQPHLLQSQCEQRLLLRIDITVVYLTQNGAYSKLIQNILPTQWRILKAGQRGHLLPPKQEYKVTKLFRRKSCNKGTHKLPGMPPEPRNKNIQPMSAYFY